MKTGFMQLTDRYVGTFFCWLLSPFRRKKKEIPKDIKNIIVIKMFGLGSIVLMAPMAKLLRKNFPDAKIHFLTFQINKEIVEIYEVADEVFIIRRDSFNLFLKDIFAVLFKIRNKKMDVILDAEFFSRFSALFSFLAKAKYNVGFYNYGIYRGDFLDKRCYFNPYRHITENFMELGRAICRNVVKIGIEPPVYSPLKEKETLSKLVKIGVPFGKKIIVFNPNISDFCPWIDRRWPLERFSSLGKFLLSKGYELVVIGSSAEGKISDNLASSIGSQALSLAGKISLFDLVTLLKNSFLLITNDSGPLHIATSLNIPTFSFFGTDTPVIYGYDSPLHSIFYKSLPCSPCLSVFNFKRGRCDLNVECIRTITLDEVIEEFERKEKFLTRIFGNKCKSEKVSRALA